MFCVWYLKCHLLVVGLGWLRDVIVVSQGCAGLCRGAAGDAQGCVAAPAEHSCPSRYHLSWGAACFPSSNNQQVMPGGDTEAELRAGDSRVGDVALLEMLLAPQGQGPWVVSQW